MTSVNTNMAALVAQKNNLEQQARLDMAMARLSSGKRINSAADDAAGSAIAAKMESQVRSLDVAIRNGHDAISMTQTAEGALGEIESILQRIRELAVSAGNSTLSQSDRDMIQNEVTALSAEIDNIADDTNFNKVQLLDGTNSSVDFQIGIDGDDGLNVKLINAKADTLGLTGTTGVATYTSERVTKGNNSAIAVSDVKINGENFLTATVADATSLTTAAATYATAINLNTGVHGAVANAFNEVSSVQKGDFVMSDAFEIGVTGATVSTGIATSYQGLVDNINEKVSGVQARLNPDNTITLFNTTGNEIVIADAAGTGASDVGFSTGTFQGFVELKNLDGSAVVVEAGSKENGFGTSAAGEFTDIAAFGFNQTSKDGLSIESGVVTTNTLDLTDGVKINDVLIGASAYDSAASKAAAINLLTSEHGVTATASNSMSVLLDFTVTMPTATEFAVNGKLIDVSSQKSVVGVVSTINGTDGIGDIVASVASDGKLQLSSASGQNIALTESATTAFVTTTVEDSRGATLTVASNVFTAFGTLNLASTDGSSIKLTDTSTTNAGLAKLGLQGGSEAIEVSNSGITVSDLASASASLSKIDAAITKVSDFRASFGAVENRIDAAINNLTTLRVNVSAQQSRIQDADFAAETSNLTKSQILSQAATSMLAQANASKQNLLALLQG
jgi:flagellin